MFEYLIQALPGEKLARFRFVLSRETRTTVTVVFVVGCLLGGLIAGIWYFFAASDAATWTLL